MKINKKGYIYTLSAIILIIILIFFILFYSRFTETETEDITGKIRCDELHFFVEDIKVDFERGLMITGRRATIYAVSNQIMGQSLITGDYRFNCTPSCPHCSNFNYSGEGAEAAIAELIFCGTLYGIPNEYMKNHSIEKWFEKLEVNAGTSGFDVNINTTKFDIAPYDAWNFISDLDLTIEIDDTTGMCYFLLYDIAINFMASLEGIEDPLYTQNTDRKVTKTISDCEIEMHAAELSEGTNGWGWVVGDAARINNISEISKLSSADKSKILVIDYDTFPDLLNGSYDSDLSKYGGIITNWDIQSVLNALDIIGIPYLAGTSMNMITENMSIILLASKYYSIDINSKGYCGSSECAIYHENGTCLVNQVLWFSESLQVCDSGHYDVKFLFPNPPKCQIAPQLEDNNNNTWNYNLDYPAKSNNIHLIGSSRGQGDYKLIVYYTDNSKDNYTITIQSHCDSGLGFPGECTNCGGKGYDSHLVSRNNRTGYIFEDVFGNTSGLEPCVDGETVQHITVPLDKNKDLKGISIHDPYNESSDNKDPVIWAVTIEMAPMSVWNLSKGAGDYASSALFRCYNVSNMGPSFFDRVENNKETTNKYQNQTNNTIGIESFLSTERLNYYGVDASSGITAMDYLYFFENKEGYQLIGANESGIGYFRIDIDYAIIYGVYDLINWEGYVSSAYENCSFEGEYCQPLVENECCGSLICFDYYYLDDSSDTCHSCLAAGYYCNISDTLYDNWCCNPRKCSTETRTCCDSSEENCTDNIDNDCDGVRNCCDTNCLSETYCTYNKNNSESGLCADGIDNDCDGDTDADDGDCTESICNDGIDNDGDTFIDCCDTDCSGEAYCGSESGYCADGIDNNCNNLTDDDDPACIISAESNCEDGIDNDGDTFIDCCDSNCVLAEPYCSNTIEFGWCNDGRDNDCDGDIDSNDSDCIESVCNDGADNDGDTFIDCCDSDCSGEPYCGSESGYCGDGMDNDCDGDIDMIDSDCDTSSPSISTVQQDRPNAWTNSATTQGAIKTGLNAEPNVRAIITDASEISSVKMYYIIKNTKPSINEFTNSITMSNVGGNIYQTNSRIPKSNNDNIWYYINATDNHGSWEISPSETDFWTYWCGK